MRLALLGCGKRLCDSVLPTLAERPGLCITALVDPRPRAIDRALSQLHALGVRVAEQVLLRARDDALPPSCLDAVVVASPHAFHERQARRWLQNGKPVFVEKPLACEYGHAIELAEISRHVGLTVSDPRRDRADLTAVGEMARSGIIGRLRRVRYEDWIRRTRGFYRNWRNDPQLAGGGVLLDLGCHTLGTLLRILATRSAELQRVDLHRSSYRVETEAHLQLCLGSALEAEVKIGLIDEHKGWEDLTLWGDAGTIRLLRARSGAARSRVEVACGKERQVLDLSAGSAHDREGLRRFLQRPNRYDAGDLRLHLTALRLISQAYEQGKSGSSGLPPDRPRAWDTQASLAINSSDR